MFEKFDSAPVDPVLALNTVFRTDARENKINLGIGVFRDSQGNTPIPAAVKAAESRLVESQGTKEYLGIAGNREFLAKMSELVLPTAAKADHLTSIQSVGGTGGVSLILEAFGRQAEGAEQVFLPSRTWGNHRAIVITNGLALASYPWPAYETISSADPMIDALEGAQPGDIIVLHANCQNPTGIDMPDDVHAAFMDAVLEKGLFPIFDAAYLGFGEGLDADIARLDRSVNKFPEAAVVVSCSKNFGLYRDRVGALFLKGENKDALANITSTIESAIRANYSMPADHGAAVVRTVLDDPDLREQWRAELEQQRQHVERTRNALAARLTAEIPSRDWSFVSDGRGMFSMLPFEKEKLRELARDHGIYILGSGRINVAGLSPDRLDEIVATLAKYYTEEDEAA